jgi:glycerate kinase
MSEIVILVAPDKFKGSLSSIELCRALEKGLKKKYPQATIKSFPMADGGDGFDEVMAYYYALDSIESAAVDPLGRPIMAGWSWDASSQTAFISVAAASGLVLLEDKERDATATSTRGTGMLIKAAIEKGAKKIVLGLGGSATNDAGMGILDALGFQLLDKEGNRLEPIGRELMHIHRILPPSNIEDVVFDIACDVTNPLYGEQGAAYVYGPQKGADAAQVRELDAGLKSVAAILELAYGQSMATIPGLGAAGGIAAGLLPYFKVHIRKGIDMIVAASGLEKELSAASLLITGEGKLDDQSLQGKVVGKLAEMARRAGKKCVVVCGINQLSDSEIREAGIQKVIALKDLAKSEKESMEQAGKLAEEAVFENLEI